MSSRRFLSITTSFAAVPCFAWNNYKSNNNKDELLLVHIFHRHGDRTPWYAIHDYEQSKKLWTPTISSHYSSFDQNTLEPLIDKNHIASWQNVASKLRVTDLAFKHDNWKKSSTTVFHSVEQNDFHNLSDLMTQDNKEYPFLGQLTKKGCQDMENVGKLLRKRYIDTMKYLPEEYDATSTNLHCHSTNFSRTIQSIDCVLHELYPTHKRKDNARIPLFVDVDLTYLSPTRLKWRWCEKLKYKAMDNEHAILQKIDSKFQGFTNMVMNYYKVAENEWKYSNHATAFDAMYCRISHDIKDKPQTFTSECLKDFGKYMVQMQCGIMGMDRGTLRLTWGNVVCKMVEYMKSVNHVDQEHNGHMIISSCHDDSLLAMLCCIYGDQIFEEALDWPPYGSYIIFELWKDGSTNNKYVKLLYNGQPLNVFDGNNVIDLNSLEQKWRDIMIDESSYFSSACVC